ncbi:DNA-3-methyladenine glycosylase family protein [Sulfurirhabdus autotrophica]|uniref:DNA-3-methyladenine glycosylase II n=1 Tax=Sulfurirhabdus autotrophica TaxID=1706046 RepID=A0A4V2W2B9_9PROT|nr:DNA-3-methyladenine glycosylase [Sulfurirhabdus autotrophica]TCV87429.1 DNA-3-methyladenine glycosylase II [Sulfurirhabdus autotrophica]
MQPDYWEQAINAISVRDPVLKNLIHAYSGSILNSRGDAFSTLARSIVGQQISVKAAESVWQKLLSHVQITSPISIHNAEPNALRACGLSSRKVSYLKDLSRSFMSGELNPEKLVTLEDDLLVVELVKVNGIGRWTAEMFMIFFLMRPNVLPLDDIGLQRAMSQLYNQKQPLTKQEMRKIAQSWEPWRSVATWYLWRSLDPVPVEY